MRGKAYGTSIAPTFRRITPAYAGKSYAVDLDSYTQQDHPRLCGEKFRFLEISPAHEGSPPPMRGKAKHWQAIPMHRRITPAYAGKSLPAEPDKYHRRGSPPPMRGKVCTTPPMLFIYRITPAYAGKSAASSYTRLSSWDHPRLCGEKWVLCWYSA